MTIFPMVYYCLFAGALAFVLTAGLGFNVGTVMLVLLAAALTLIVLRIRRTAAPAPPAVTARE